MEFDNRKEKKQKKIEPDPWKNIDIISNQDEEIKLFGTHTVLVHSIAMFLIVTLLMILLAICIMNFLNYTPEYFKSIPITFS